MNEEINNEKNLEENQEIQTTEYVMSTEEGCRNTTKKKKLLSKKYIILACIVLALVIVVVAVVLLYESKFDKTKEVVSNMVASEAFKCGEDYFTLDTYPEDYYATMNPAFSALLSSGLQDRVIEAIQFANKELGFNGSLYSRMLETTSIMGRQSEENSDYKVSWTFHPDRGLTVTYEKK